MKFLKISLYVLAGVVLLLVIVGGVFVATFDANDYRPLITEQVKQQTGREMVLEDIKPSVFPWLGVELQEISLSNANGFKAEKMLQITRLDVRVELLPLLNQEVRIDTLRLHGLKLFLEKNKKAKTNWDDILEKQAEPVAFKAATTDVTKDSEEVPADPLAALLINGVEIKDASINWDDASTGQIVAIQNFNLDTGAIRPGESLPVALSALLELAEPKTTVKFELNTSVDISASAQKLKLADLNVAIDAVLDQEELKGLQLSLNTSLNADLNKQHFILPAYALDIEMQGKSIPDEKLKVSFRGDADIDLIKETAKIEQLLLQSLGLKLKSQLVVTKLLTSPKLRAQIELENFDPEKIFKALAIKVPVTKSKAVLKNASMNLNMVASESYLQISGLKLKLDETEVLADARLQNFDKPAVKFALDVDQINLDDYFPPAAKPMAGVQKNSPAGAANIDVPIDLPVSMLRSLDVNGELAINSLVVSDQAISNFKTKITAKQGLIHLPVLTANLLKGSVVSSARLDVRNNSPRYQFKLKGKSLNADSIIDPVLQDMLGEKSVSISGVTHLNIDIKTKGQSVNQLIAGSNGRFDVKMGKAKLHGVDAEYFVRKGVVGYAVSKGVKVKEKWIGKYKPKEATALKKARGSFVIRNGIVDNKDLLLVSSRFNIMGAGKINLVKEVLNYRLVIDIKPEKLEKVEDQLLNVPMPLYIKGAFLSPDVSIGKKSWKKGLGKVLKNEAKKEAKKKLDKKIDKYEDKYRKKIKGWFK
ncbi:MAG: hypothetical protein DIZ80_08525 [endosymbiont of Galathealinum brachiosum]|uniref:AsmA domain-containing protein n=1 Tax=endosymbiont of Galathealinum brachiosum TaxID=2200906 RepID=A0A370DBP8_9GAMM|nr:MAG: hypothetical protein DIZ80_08525 [endosymbiont of Galathealinum brachiosum]